MKIKIIYIYNCAKQIGDSLPKHLIFVDNTKFVEMLNNPFCVSVKIRCYIHTHTHFDLNPNVVIFDIIANGTVNWFLNTKS